MKIKPCAGIDKLKEAVKYIEGNQEEYGCTELLNKLLKEVWDYINLEQKNIIDGSLCMADCKYRRGEACVLDVTNHCIRRAEDFYTKEAENELHPKD